MSKKDSGIQIERNDLLITIGSIQSYFRMNLRIYSKSERNSFRLLYVDSARCCLNSWWEVIIGRRIKKISSNSYIASAVNQQLISLTLTTSFSIFSTVLDGFATYSKSISKFLLLERTLSLNVFWKMGLYFLGQTIMCFFAGSCMLGRNLIADTHSFLFYVFTFQNLSKMEKSNVFFFAGI